MSACPVTGLILAGGKGARMGGADKGLVKFKGTPMVQIIARQFIPQCQALLVNANRNIHKYEALGYTVVSDQLVDFQGPLAGFLSGLKTMQTQWLITVPCDAPYLSQCYVKNMFEIVINQGHLLAVAKSQKRLQPVYALIHYSLLPSLEDFLKRGERKVDKWFGEFDYCAVNFSDTPNMFTNINTQEQLVQ